MIKVCMVGLGKTGREIVKVLLAQEDIKLVAAVCSPSSSNLGKDIGEIVGCADTGIIVESSDNIEQMIFRSKPDVAIDFTNPSAALKNARIFSKMKVNLVIGTTGFSNFACKKLFVLTRKYHSGIVYTPNITLGVNVLMLLSNLASCILNNYDFQITEIHHKYKKDSPSGTALKISNEIKKGLISSGVSQEDINIPISSVRAGGVVGKHEVMIIGEDDKIEITHESFSRKAFALGAIRAVKFIYKNSGYYEMSDVLNLGRILSEYVERDDSMSKKWRKYNIADIPVTVEDA
ncbi:MAG: 4-hydroxy-tetrahydrodipicolinate reductase [Bacillota bacterium]|nr:4-hydroxy-tetrahydrodipicolinate reductase [Bacillota bacterium]